MKKYRLFLIGVVILSCLLVMGSSTFTIDQGFQDSWKLLRTEADEDSSSLDFTTKGDFANKLSGAIEIKANDAGGLNAKNMTIAFWGGSAADKTFSYKVIVWRAINGPAEVVCTGTGTTGTQAVGTYPHNKAAATSKFWADTLTVADDTLWYATPVICDSGNNRMCKLQFAWKGYGWIYVEITSADGETGDEAGDVGIVYAVTN